MPSKTNDTTDFAGDPPTDINPYEVLSVPENATEDDIKKAYRRAALKHHPDKVADDEKASAHATFQNIAFAYAVLSDARRRKRYDSTGSTAETLDLDDDDFDWLAFYREQWVEAITPDAIEKDRKKYVESGEQRTALLAAYTKFKGNMDMIYQVVMHSNILEDDSRFREILDGAIEGGEVEALDKYTNETEKSKKARIAKAEREAREAERARKELDTNSRKKKKKVAAERSTDLAALIQGRQAERGSRFLEQLEEKYAGSNGKSKKRDEPPEEAFTAAAERQKKKAKK